MRPLFLALLCAVGVLTAGELSNRRAPGFSLPDVQTRQWDIQDFRGKVVLLDIMQTNCPHCRTLAGTLEKIRGKYGNRIQVISLVVPPDNQTTVSQFIATYRIGSPIVFDCGQAVASYMKIGPQNPTLRFPHVFVIDGNGMIRNDFAYTEQNKAIFEGDGLSAEIDKLLGPQAPAGKKK